ncbi:MAG: DUF5677 domain-containing protein [candidate division Zixibacteria bacterium]
MKYPTKCKEEIDSLMDQLMEKLNEFNYPKDLYCTKTLCRCFMSSIFSLIRSAYATIEGREIVGFNVLGRSITEYLIDLRYIAANNDVKINRRFINYYKLLLYWNRDEFKFIDVDKDQLESNYRNYLANEFSELIITAKKKNDAKDKLSLSELDKSVKSKYKKSWSGLNSVDRLNNVIKHYDNSIINKYLPFAFKFLSNYTHPTVYGCIPYFRTVDHSFYLDYDKKCDAMEEEEGVMYLAIEITVEALCKTLPANESHEIDNLVESIVSSSPKLLEIRDSYSDD